MTIKTNQKSGNLYGLFDQNAIIDNFLTTDIQSENRNRNIFSKGFLIAIRGERILFLNEKIYNPDEIQKNLNYKASSLADLVFELIDREGITGCRRLNGKFTIIISEKDKTTIIRDRNGEGKMIYYTKDFFTDSYQGLFDFKNFKPEPNLTGITTFLKIGYIPAPVTSLAGVSKVPAGEVLYVSKAGFHLEKLFSYDEILQAKRIDISAEEATEAYSDLLKKSLKRRINDVETVGILLSGGYDSGGNIAMAREIHPGKIKTYSIGFKDNPASELPYARMMADQYNAEHHEYIMDGSEIEFLPEIIDAMGDPFSESGFMLNHSVMKMVSTEDLPVTIGGDGNDQYFGAGIRETALHYKMCHLGLKPFAKLFDRLSQNSIFDHDNPAFRISYQNQKILRVMEPETFGFPDFQLNKMFNLKEVPSHGYLDKIHANYGSY